MGDEGFAEVYGGRVVCDQLLVENREIDSIGLGEVKGALDARIDKDAVDVGVLDEDFRGEFGNLELLASPCALHASPYFVQFCHINDLAFNLVAAMLANKLLQVLFSAAGYHDGYAVLNQSGCKSPANSRGSADNEDFIEGHDDTNLGYRI